MSAATEMSICDRSSSAQGGWFYSLGPLEPHGDMVYTGQVSVLAVRLNSGEGWEGSRSCSSTDEEVCFLGDMAASWSLMGTSTLGEAFIPRASEK